MNRIPILLTILGLTLAANTATAEKVDIHITLGHSPAYVNAPHYSRQQIYYPQPNYALVYRPAYQAEVHYLPVYQPAHVVSPHHEYRPHGVEHGLYGFGGRRHHSTGRGH